jgi:hypothetical protein
MRYASLQGHTVGRCEGCGQRVEATPPLPQWSDWAFGCTLACTLQAVRRRRDAWEEVRHRAALPRPWRDYLESVAADNAWVRSQLTVAFDAEIARLEGAIFLTTRRRHAPA